MFGMEDNMIDITTEIGYTNNKGGIPMFTFEDNDQMRKEIKVLLAREETSGTQVAKKMGISQQNFHRTINKVNFAFTDARDILDALGYDLEINFRKRI